MTSAPKLKQQALSEQLSKPREDPGTFENIPKIPTIAGDSVGPYVIVCISKSNTTVSDALSQES